MSRIAAKLGFAHRRLWQRDGTYRAAVLLGPAPLLGGALAAALWAGVHAPGRTAAAIGQMPPWAHPHEPETIGNAGPKRAEQPAMPLPPNGTDGLPSGYATGWQGGVAPIEVSPTLAVNVLRTPLATFTLDQTTVDMAPILAAGPATGLFVGVGTASMAIRVPGDYALSVRIARSSAQSANCLARFAFAGHRLVSDLSVGMAGSESRSYEPVDFTLQPGLYRIGVAFGCWHERQAIGPGQLTVMIRHPGEQLPRPARPDEILRPLPPP